MSDKPPIVLLHGWGGHYREAWVDSGWESKLEASGRELIKINLPGHGLKSASHDPEDYASIADDVESMLDGREGIQGMGYSLGAKILLEISCRNPNVFDRLVLASIGENAFQPLRASSAIANTVLKGVDDSTPDMLVEIYRYVLAAGNDRKAMAACMLRPQDAPITAERLKVVRCPVLVVNGDQDHVVLPADGLLESLNNSEAMMIPNVGHFDLLTNKIFQEKAHEFLQSNNN